MLKTVLLLVVGITSFSLALNFLSDEHNPTHTSVWHDAGIRTRDAAGRETTVLYFLNTEHSNTSSGHNNLLQ